MDSRRKWKKIRIVVYNNGYSITAFRTDPDTDVVVPILQMKEQKCGSGRLAQGHTTGRQCRDLNLAL